MCSSDDINPANNQLAKDISKTDLSGSADTVQKAFETGNWGEPLGSQASGWDVLGAGPTGLRGIGGSSDNPRDRAVGRSVGEIFAGEGLGQAAGAASGSGAAASTAGEGVAGGAEGGTGLTLGSGGETGLVAGGGGDVAGQAGQGLIAPAGTSFAGGDIGAAVGAGGAISGVGSDFGGTFSGGGAGGAGGAATPGASSPTLGSGLKPAPSTTPSAPGAGVGNDPNLPPGDTPGAPPTPPAASPSATTPPANAPTTPTTSQPSMIGKALDYLGVTSPKGGLGPNALPIAGLGYSAYSANKQQKSAEARANRVAAPANDASQKLIAEGLSGQVPPAIAARYEQSFRDRVSEIQQRYANMGRDPKTDSAAQAEIAKAAQDRDAAIAAYSQSVLNQGLVAAGVAQGPQMAAIEAGANADKGLQDAIGGTVKNIGTLQILQAQQDAQNKKNAPAAPQQAPATAQ